MNIKNCRKCGKIFNYVGGPQICQACAEALESKFQEVKAYISEHKQASGLKEVSEACEVDINQIRQWVREERLTFGDDSVMGVECENCGAVIKTGRFCEKCKKEMANSLNDSFGIGRKAAPEAKKPEREAARMRFLDR